MKDPTYCPDPKRMEDVVKALDKPDPPNYRGDASREYQKELGRKILRHGYDNTVGDKETHQRTDQDIALRLLAAGYTDKQTNTAITKASPEAVNHSTGKTPNLYGEKITESVLKHEQTQKVIGEHRRDEIKNGNEHERRLEKLKGLSTRIEPEHKREPGSRER